MEFKNLKVPKATHAALTKRAKQLGMKVYTLADALLDEALKKNDPALREVVATKQQDEITQTSESTSQEPPAA